MGGNGQQNPQQQVSPAAQLQVQGQQRSMYPSATGAPPWASARYGANSSFNQQPQAPAKQDKGSGSGVFDMLYPALPQYNLDQILGATGVGFDPFTPQMPPGVSYSPGYATLSAQPPRGGSPLATKNRNMK
jgi:hypothetical protein